MNILALTARLDFLSTTTLDSFLTKAKEFSVGLNMDWFVEQVATTWSNHLSLRTSLQEYDVDVATMFRDIVSGSQGALVNYNSFTGVASVYGIVLHREAYPTINASRGIWNQLPSTASAGSKFAAQAVASGDVAPVIREYILQSQQKRSAQSPFREPECIQSDTSGAAEANLCYTSCSVTCYRDELGYNYSRIAPTYPETLSYGAQSLLHWIIGNRVWLDSIIPQVFSCAVWRPVLRSGGDAVAPRIPNRLPPPLQTSYPQGDITR